jgi:Rrf2 family protein
MFADIYHPGMRLTEGVEWAAHCLVLLAGLPPETGLSAARLAEYHDVPAPYLAKSLQALSGAGIISSRVGRHGGYRLTRPPDEITLLDVINAVDGEESLFRCTEIRRQGPSRVGARQYPPVCAIAAAMRRAEAAWRRELRATTIADLADLVQRQAPARAIQKTTAWLAGAQSAGVSD